MEAQKAQEEHAAAVSPDAGPGGGRPGSGGGIIIQRRIGKREGKGHYGGEVASLRESLQKLCQCTNPLGKTMDYIQEDLDNMHKELESWKTERRKLSNELNDKSTDFEKMMQPLADKKLKVAQEVAEMKEKIVSMKTQIATNDEKIEKMLAMVVSAN
jgi:chromosome segregation ATPase